MIVAPLHIEVDTVDRAEWDQVLRLFDDACIEQAWAFATAANPNTQVSHVLLKQGTEIVACCQTQLRRIPVLGLGVADVRWGPMVCRRGSTPDPDLLFIMVRAIKEEYGLRRGCLLRISPHVTRERKDDMRHILEAEGFQEDRSERPYRTLMLDLSPPLEELRSNLLYRWRRHLNKAEKSDLTVLEGTGDELFHTFLNLATEMCERKHLRSLAGYRHYRHIQEALPEFFKMRIFVSQRAGEPVAVTIGSAIGDTGVYMLGATSAAGLELGASYLVHWRMIEWLKSVGMRYYDLGAINPKLNPGGYIFKQGIAGKSGRDETFLHRYYGCFTRRARTASWLMKCLQLVRRARRAGP